MDFEIIAKIELSATCQRWHCDRNNNTTVDLNWQRTIVYMTSFHKLNYRDYFKYSEPVALVKVMAVRKVKRSKKKLSFILVFFVSKIFFPTFQDSRTYLYIKNFGCSELQKRLKKIIGAYWIVTRHRVNVGLAGFEKMRLSTFSLILQSLNPYTTFTTRSKTNSVHIDD